VLQRRNREASPLSHSKQRKGAPHSIIERPGRDGQYTTHQGDGTHKQYRGSGKDHGGMPRPNVKESVKVKTPDGEELIDRGRIRPPKPNEIPKAK